MNFIYNFIPEELIKAIGWTIFHSLWQGAMIAVLLSGVLLVTGKKGAQLRYNFSFAALVLMFLFSLATFTQVYDPSGKTASSDFGIISGSTLPSQSSTDVTSTGVSGTNLNFVKVIEYYFSQNVSAIVTLWLLGFIFFSMRFIGGVLYVQRLKTVGINPLNDFWYYRLKELSKSIGVKQLVEIYESSKVKAPVAMGYLKPAILLPLGMLTGLPQEQVEAIIIHELVHIKRYDFILNLIQTLIETIFFYHPVVWWVTSTINNERENCCDDLTLKLCGGSLVYFKALYNLQQICSEENELALAAIGKKNQLFRRINRMTTKNKNTSYGVRFAAFAVLLLVITAVSIYSSLSAKDNPHGLTTASFINHVTSLSDIAPYKNPAGDINSIPDTTSLKKGTRTLKFYDKVDGEEKKFKAKLNNGKLEELYIDGEKVPEKDLNKYENKITERLNEYDSAIEEFHSSMNKYKQEMKQFKEKMKKFKGNYSYNHDFDFDSDFDIPPIPPVALDTTEWKGIMKDVQKNLRENLVMHSFKIPPIHIPKIDIPSITIPPMHFEGMDSLKFDNEAFKESMKELKEKMKDFKFDNEAFKESMKEWKDKMKDFKFDTEKFNEEMKKNGPNSEAFKNSMKELKVNMGKLKKSMKVLKEFINDTKDELVKDNLLKPGDDLEDFYLSKDEMKVDGKKVTPELHKKYLELYKKHFGKELKGDEKFRIND
ncbi:MAG: M48 family metalloprotease [Ignavibacteriales bacterium]|nr:M48 family metalloprotease [Ignavibacteriales bacterium]